MDGGAFMMPELARWRGRAVRYYGGKWDEVRTFIPAFRLEEFASASGSASNPFLKAVVRVAHDPAKEDPMPVGIVSSSYGLVQHATLAECCLGGMKDQLGVDRSSVRCELGLSELGEWMNLRLYFPPEYSYVPKDGEKLDLRAEMFNSVDGSSRLILLLGWFRLICSNGLVIGKSLLDIRDTHKTTIDISRISRAFTAGARLAAEDKARMAIWQATPVTAAGVEEWVNDRLSEQWGKKAACRVFHICTSGNDVEWTQPFEKGPASKKTTRDLERVPGSRAPAETLYDVCQALSFVATRRKDAEERVTRQAEVPNLLEALAA